jgi:hypothetical protein
VIRRQLLALALVGLALLTGACSAAPEDTTATTISSTGPTITTVVTTTQPVVAVDASFAIGIVAFGDGGWIEVVNTGSQPGNVHGLWIAIHPFYLELPSTIVEVGEAVTVTLDPDADPDAAELIHAAGLLPVLVASGGEVALYSNGNFGNPEAIVDYVEWGSGGHFRSTVAEAAGIWDAGRVVPMTGNEAGLIVGDGVPQPLEADLLPSPQG